MSYLSHRILSRISPESTILLLCDMQEKFRDNICFFPQIVEVSRRLLDAAKILEMAIVATEQYPKGLGKTVHELNPESQLVPVFEKTKFSMCIPPLEKYLTKVDSVLLCGIEAHVCVFHTALDLLSKGIAVHVVVDAVSSRAMVDRKYAFKQLSKAGAILTTSECAILALVRDAAHPKFRNVQKLILKSAPDSGLVSV